jgi:hypothetical protein
MPAKWRLKLFKYKKRRDALLMSQNTGVSKLPITNQQSILSKNPTSVKLQNMQDISNKAKNSESQIPSDHLLETITTSIPKEDFTETFLSTFGAKNINKPRNLFDPKTYNNQEYLSGYSREIDLDIIKLLAKQLDKHQGLSKLRCLEVGCGPTYPTFDEIGGAFLLRKIASAFPDRLECVGIDPVEIQVLFITCPDGRLKYCELPNSYQNLDPLLVNLSQFEVMTNGKLLANPIHYLTLDPSIAKLVKELARNLNIDQSELSHPDCKLFIRPKLDYEFEKHNFVIEVKCIDLLKKNSLSSMGSFDLIFGRNLFPLDLEVQEEQITEWIKAIQPLLQAEGVGVIEFDGTAPIFFNKYNPDVTFSNVMLLELNGLKKLVTDQ